MPNIDFSIGVTVDDGQLDDFQKRILQMEKDVDSGLNDIGKQLDSLGSKDLKEQAETIKEARAQLYNLKEEASKIKDVLSHMSEGADKDALKSVFDQLTKAIEGTQQRIGDAQTALNASLSSLDPFGKKVLGLEEEIDAGLAKLKDNLKGAFEDADILSMFTVGKDAIAGAEEELEALRENAAKVKDLLGHMADGVEKDTLTKNYELLNGKIAETEKGLKEAKETLAAFSSQFKKIGIISAAAAVAIAATVAIVLKLTEDCRRINGYLTTGFAAAEKSMTDQLAAYKKAQAIWRTGEGDASKLNSVLQEQREELEKCGYAINSIDEGNQLLVDHQDAVVAAIRARAVAYGYEAAAQQAVADGVAKIMDGELKIAKMDNRSETNPFTRALNKFRFGGMTGNEDWESDWEEWRNGRAENIRNRKDKKSQAYLDAADSLFDKEQEKIEEAEKLEEASGVTDKEKDAFRKRTRALQYQYEEQQKALAKTQRGLELEATETRVAAMQEGILKEVAQLRQNHEKRIEAINNEKQDYINTLKATAKAEWLAANPGFSEADYNPNSFQLSDEQMQYIEKMFGENGLLRSNENESFANQTKTAWDNYFTEVYNAYGTFEQKKQALVIEWEQKLNNVIDDNLQERAKLYRDAAMADLEFQEVEQYGSFEEKINAFRKKIAAETKTLADNLKEGAEKAFVKTLADYAEEWASSGDDLDMTRFVAKVGSMSLPAMEKALAGAQEEMGRLGKTGQLTGEQSAKLGAKIAYLSQKVKEGKKNWEEYVASGEYTNDKLMTLSETFSSLGQALGEFGGNAGKVGESMQAIGSGVSAFVDLKKSIDSGDTLGVITGGVEGISKILATIGSQTKENKEAMDDWKLTVTACANELKLLEIEQLSYQQSNLFGVENPYSKAAAGTLQYAKAISVLKEQQDKLAGGKVQTGTKKVVSGKNTLEGVAGGAAAGAAIGTAVGGWAMGLGTVIGAAIGGVVGGITAAFTAKEVVPVFNNLLSQYGYLYDDETYELNPEIVADYNKLDDATKEIVSNWEEIKNKAKEAEQAMKENFSELSGDLGGKLSDALVAAFRNGELDSAISDFHGTMTSTIEDIIQQIAFSTAFEGLFKDLEGSMMASFDKGGDQSIIDDLERFDTAYQDRLKVYQNEMQELVEKYGNGYDLFSNTAAEDQRTASVKGIAGLTQDQGEELNGRFTAIQGHTFEITDHVREIRTQNALTMEMLGATLMHIVGIHDNTAHLDESVAEVSGMVREIRESVGTMVDKGVIMN